MGERGGTILLLSSGAGVTTGSSSYAYGSSKGGIHGLGLVLQQRLAGRPIRVNTVCPSGIATPLKVKNVEDGARAEGLDAQELAERKRQLADPAGVARVLALLVSDDADYVRGTIFTR
jgi:NAD(P)-dependent dehydrogenase (short-subunit alcohol dehydrogenase family)